MPGGDRTGPLGNGPLTGGGFGRCRFEEQPLPRSQYGFGRRIGTVAGRGGWRHRYWAAGRPGWLRGGGRRRPEWSDDDERRALEREVRALEDEVRRLGARIEEFDRSGSSPSSPLEADISP